MRVSEVRKYTSEQKALHNGVRRKSLERPRRIWLDAVLAFCLAILLLLLVCGAVWLFLVAASHP